ncbi:porin family protein [Aegicerativicinus sediminis]|uniref:porin family protein n=1 Tax=Aegicerativicinus sediminis TaxID=2893202 RepID=UPI001E3BEC02|nr:porin family protein [Aegicerativicinus sediminis]
MKTILFTIAMFLLVFNLNAQNFGIRAGADFATAKADFDGYKISDNQTGFYIGVFTRLTLSEKFKIRPEVNYIYVEDLNMMQIPVLAELEMVNKLNICAGPSFGFLLDTEEGEKSFNMGLDFGVSYNITEKFLAEARYSLGLSNLVEDNMFDATLKLHGLFVGLGYMF